MSCVELQGLPHSGLSAPRPIPSSATTWAFRWMPRYELGVLELYAAHRQKFGRKALGGVGVGGV